MKLIIVFTVMCNLALGQEKKSKDDQILECHRRAKLRAEVAYGEDPYLKAKYEAKEADRCYKQHGIVFQD